MCTECFFPVATWLCCCFLVDWAMLPPLVSMLPASKLKLSGDLCCCFSYGVPTICRSLHMSGFCFWCFAANLAWACCGSHTNVLSRAATNGTLLLVVTARTLGGGWTLSVHFAM